MSTKSPAGTAHIAAENAASFAPAPPPAPSARPVRHPSPPAPPSAMPVPPPGAPGAL